MPSQILRSSHQQSPLAGYALTAMPLRFHTRFPSGLLALAMAGLVLVPTGCVRTVLEGEDPDVARPVATGDPKRDVLVVDLPWMQAPMPRLLYQDKPVVCEQVRAYTPDRQTSLMLRTRAGVNVTVLIAATSPSPDQAEFVYEVQKLPSGYTLDLPIALGNVGRRGPIKISVNGAPFNAPPSTDAAIVPLARDSKTRILATRVPPAGQPGTAAQPAAATQPASAAQPAKP